tara:strand:+ start:22359 stop:23540 length:1182 start_codon:yes stop_codon:yes gene_type:complete
MKTRNLNKYKLSRFRYKMNSVIYDINEPFDFEQINLNPPMIVAGGNYFIKYSINGGALYIQPPECKTRGTITKTTKKTYCDLMFSQENDKFIEWMEDLETKTCKMIYDKREEWFDSEMDLADIENYFSSPLKSYKSGKFYLARTSIPTRLGKISLKIYNENKEEIDIDSIKENTQVVSILEIQGIKCSARSFQIEMEIKQLMTLKPVNLFDNCLISSNKKTITHQSQTKHIEKDLDITDENKDDTIEVDTDEPESLEENIIIETSEDNEALKNEEPDKESNDITLEESISLQPEIENVENSDTTEKNDLDDFEFNVDLEKIDKEESFTIKPHNDIYYERYREAQKRARIAKNLALQAYLEAKEIKNKYRLDDIDSDDDDFFNNEETELEESTA